MIICEAKIALLKAQSDAYADIEAVLGKGTYEVPDCGHHVKHIHVTKDATLGINVFGFDLHVHEDDDRCINKDRQRNEIKVYGNSPSWMQGTSGSSFSYSWKFKIDSKFQYTTHFCHLHQIKNDQTDTLPYVTLTATSVLTLDINSAKVASVSIDQLKGQWVHVKENIKYGSTGYIQIALTRISDGKTLLQYENNVSGLFGGSFMRPKWGIYRSLTDSSELRNETVLFADFCIGQNLKSCDNY